MSKPFYLRCDCGGEIQWPGDWDQLICPRCRRGYGVKQTIERYAAALGTAIEMLPWECRQIKVTEK